MLMLVSMAVTILRARSSKVIPGIHWGRNFLSRHPSIELKYCQYLEKHKITAIVEEQRMWFRALRIFPENLWNCDEKGIIMGSWSGHRYFMI